MESKDTIAALAALAQETRLEVFRRLVAAEPQGMAAGDIARALGVPANTLSAHLATLARAGLVVSTRFGRSIVYRAEISRLADLVGGLVGGCCGGRPELCAPWFSGIVDPELHRGSPCPTSPSSTIPPAGPPATSSA